MRLPRIDPKISVSIVFVASMFMSIMDSTIVNVALPSIGRQLNVPIAFIDGIVVSYVVSLAVVIPASGWLGDRLGTKRVFLIALAFFTLASALCGLASNITMLVVLRALQGAAGGALTPVGTAILYRTFPPAERVQLSRILIIPTVIAPAAGPVLGGLLVDQLSWRWVFYVNVPIGIIVCLFGLFYLQEHREPGAGGFDVVGFVLAGLGLSLVMYALSEGSARGWTSFSILASSIVGVIALAAFVAVEMRIPEPMLDLHLLGNRLFRTTNLSSMFASAGFLGVLYVGPLFLQEARGVSALTSGLTTFPEAIGVVISTQIIARIYPSIGPRRVMAAGLISVVIFMSLLTLMSSDTTLWFMRFLMFLIGAGMACSFFSVQTAGFATISPAATGRASAIFSAQRQIGSALGVAILSSVLNAVGTTIQGADGVVVPNLWAYHAAFLTSAALILVAVGFALIIQDRDAAATMIRKVALANDQKDDVPQQMLGAGTNLQHSVD
jgi:EmrB/QacA subfamily drug resistance transporter